jgi:tetratricopeptide (TPR) repeat protein
MRIRKVSTWLSVVALWIVVLTTGVVNAQNGPTETDDKQKVDLYTQFVDNYKTNPVAAYQTAKEYLQHYAKEKDQYADYVQRWVTAYERVERLRQLRHLVYDDRNYAEAFKLGKQVVAENPNNLDSLITLANAGYLAANARNESFNSEALGYAQSAIQMLDAGKTPENWDPFKGKADTLAYLHNTVGLIKLKTAPDDAINSLLKAASLESDLTKLPTLYYYLARAYETGPYAKLSADYQARFAGKPESAESKQALDKLNQVIDRMIDAYARAIAVAGNEAAYAANKTAWMTTLTNFYKFRHADSDAGLTEFIASAPSRPLPARP